MKQIFLKNGVEDKSQILKEKNTKLILNFLPDKISFELALY